MLLEKAKPFTHHIGFCNGCFQTVYYTMLTRSRSSKQTPSLLLSSHTFPLHFPSDYRRTAES